MISSLLSKQNKNIIFDFCNEGEKKELYELFLEIIKEGNSYPQAIPFSFEEFLNYFFPKNSKALICKDKETNEIIGGFYIKPNFSGRCSHIANCGYIVKKEYRGQKIGFHLGKCSIDIARELGYKAIIFNLVFRENIAALTLWKKLGFKIIGTIPNAVRKDDGSFQDACIMFLSLNSS
ncbi:MAG: GNAT family N-acetyltransferase [Candidatus Melainabacteria bacterium]|nr:GNAT family N-acetyltransferase [Candidatus Melainabacteria bacterium]